MTPVTAYRRCPVCDARLFHARLAGRFAVFRITAELTVEPVHPLDLAPGGDAPDPVSCTACSWSGPPTSLPI